MPRREGSKAESAEAPLLDQASSQRLSRASGDYTPRAVALPPSSSSGPPRRAGRARQVVMGAVLPPCFFALAAVMFFGLARGTAGNLAGDGRLSAADIVMVALLVIAALAVFNQGLGLLRRQPRGRALLARAGAAVPRWQKAEAEPLPATVPLLDQSDAEALAAAAPPDLGSGNRAIAAARTGWRAFDTLLWVALGALSIGVAAFAAFGMSFSVWKAVERGSFTPLLVMLTVLCAMAFVGLAMMARTVVLAVFDRRLRKRRPAFIRFFRYASKRMTSGTTGEPRDRSAAVVTAVAAFVLIAVAFWPEVSDAFGGLPGDNEGVLASAESSATAPPTLTPARTTLAAQVMQTPAASLPFSSSPTPASASSNATALASTPAIAATSTGGVAPSPTSVPPVSTPSAVPTSTATPTPTASSSPSPTAAPTTLPTPAPTSTPASTPQPTPLTPTPTPPPPADTDGDGVPNTVELMYGSNPNDPDATPENKLYDGETGASTCHDGLNNDKSGGIDEAGSGGQGPDTKCV